MVTVGALIASLADIVTVTTSPTVTVDLSPEAIVTAESEGAPSAALSVEL